jgi:Ca2+-transporting ATPase
MPVLGDAEQGAGPGDAERRDGGLSPDEIGSRLRQYGPNTLPSDPGPGIGRRVLEQLRDPMILLLLVAGLLAVLIGEPVDAAIILAVVLVNTGVGVGQQVRAERALAALGRMAAPTASVIRGGQRVRIPAAEVVPGDLVLVEAGDVVPADAIVVEAVRLAVDQSALTGESVPIPKELGADTALYAGSVITGGRGRAVVERTGRDSALGRIAALMRTVSAPATPLQRRLARLSRTLTWVVLVLCGVVAVSGLVRGLEPGDMALTAISLAVAAVPESLPAVATLGLALGAHRMAQRAAVVRSLPAVETLGAVTVLAVDKTGTLTENRMVAERLWTPVDGYVRASGSGYAPTGRLTDATGTPLADSSPTITALLRDVALCNDADVTAVGAEWRPLGDPTEAALVALAARGGVLAGSARDTHPRVLEAPFESIRARMTTVHATVDPERWLVVCKGAPEVLLADDGMVGERDRRNARLAAAELAAAGYRVLAVADRLGDRPGSIDAAEGGLRLVGLVGIADPARPEAKSVVAALGTAGVRVVMITGDHPGTAAAIGNQVGIQGTLVSGDEVDALLRDPAAVAACGMFARVRPEQKLGIIHALQAAGQVVAMTGDGVNDAPALRAADIGVAMGAGGTEVARQAADLVLTDDRLPTVLVALEEGRRITTNVRTFLRYALAGGCAELVVMLLGPLFGLGLPVVPAQFLWFYLVTHGPPGVALGAEPPDPTAAQLRPRPIDEHPLGDRLAGKIAWTGMLIAAVTLTAGAFGHATGRPWQTMVFLTLGLAQLGVALALRSPGGRGRPRFLDLAVAVAAALQVGACALPWMRSLLDLEAPGPAGFAVALVAAAVPGLVVAVLEIHRRRVGSVAEADVRQDPAQPGGTGPGGASGQSQQDR